MEIQDANIKLVEGLIRFMEVSGQNEEAFGITPTSSEKDRSWDARSAVILHDLNIDKNYDKWLTLMKNVEQKYAKSKTCGQLTHSYRYFINKILSINAQHKEAIDAIKYVKQYKTPDAQNIVADEQHRYVGPQLRAHGNTVISPHIMEVYSEDRILTDISKHFDIDRSALTLRLYEPEPNHEEQKDKYLGYRIWRIEPDLPWGIIELI